MLSLCNGRLVYDNAENLKLCKNITDKQNFAPLFFEKIDINIANYELLLSVPGIGPAIAEKIILLRNQRGKISNLSQLLDIHGIGPKKLQMFKKYIAINNS